MENSNKQDEAKMLSNLKELKLEYCRFLHSDKRSCEVTAKKKL